NQEQKVYTFIDNPTRQAQKVSVKLQVGNPPADLAASPLVQVAAGKTELFDFGKIAPPPPGMPPAFTPLDGPPYRFQFVIVDDKGKEVARQMTYAGLLRPAQYLDVPEIRYESEVETLRADVSTLPDFSGSPCQVDLVLSSISGLDPASARASGSYRVTLQ